MATPYVNPLLAIDRLRRGLPQDPNEEPLEEIPESQEIGFVGQVGRGALTGIETVGKVLDAPQEALFRAITGRDPSTYGDRDGETSGRELLRELGVLRRGAPDTWGNFSAGLATDLVADPLNLIGVGLLGKGGRLASKVGALGRAGESFTLAAKRGAPIADSLTQRAVRGAERAGRRLQDIPDVDIVGRPLVRPRAASRHGSVDDLIKAAEAGVDVPGVERLRGLDAGARAAPLSYDIGIGPTQALSLKFNVPGGAAVRDALDALVSGAKFGRAGQLFRQVFDRDVGEAGDLASQTYTTGQNILARRAEAAKKAESIAEIAKLRSSESGDAIFSEEGNRSLGRIIERPTARTSAQNRADAALLGEEGSVVRQYRDWWETAGRKALQESAEVGLPSQAFSDPNVSGYLPRALSDSISELVGRRGGDSQKVVSTLTGDMLSRSDATMVPGGRDFLSFELARDEFLVGAKRGAKTDADAASHIQRRIAEHQAASGMDATGIAQKDAMELARLLNRMPNPGDTSQQLFGQHPTEMITSYLGGRAKAVSNARNELDVIGSYAEQTMRGVDGEVSVTVDDALKRLNLASDESTNGTKRILRETIARRKGLDPDSIELATYQIPESVLLRMTRMKDVAKDPKQQLLFMQAMRYMQAIWRNSILTWPSRYVRDLMGGFFQNALETGNPITLVTRGYPFAKRLLFDKASAFDEDVVASIMKMPHYADMPAEKIGERFYGDLAATGLLSGSSKLDRGVAGLEIAEELPGFGRLLPEMGPLSSAPKFLAGIFNPDSSFARAGAKLGDSTDTISRLAGYAELLFQGFSPEEAARRIKRSQVDYASLSEAEKRIRNYAIPFYTFGTRTAMETGRRLLEEPASMNALIRASQAFSGGQDDDQYLPQFARERTVLGSWPGANDSQNVLYNLDIPALSSVEGFGSPGEFVPNLASQFNPFLKTAVENIWDRDSFTKRPLSETRGDLARITGAGPGGAMQWLDRGISFVPFGSRVTNLARDLVENKDQRSRGELYGQTAINLLTGLKMKNISTDELLNDASRSTEERLGGLLRTHTSKYVPKEILPFLPESVQRDYRNYRQLNKIRQTRKKRREEEMAQ